MCNYSKMNTRASIKFANGYALSGVGEVDYLGAKFIKKHFTRLVLGSCIGKATETPRKLKDFFKQLILPH